VVQEDKLRVGPRHVLHHQVVAEGVKAGVLKLSQCSIHKQTYERVTAVNLSQRILKRNVLDHKGLDLGTEVGIHVFHSEMVSVTDPWSD